MTSAHNYAERPTATLVALSAVSYQSYNEGAPLPQIFSEASRSGTEKKRSKPSSRVLK
jgi:hypothetical protein